VIRLARSWLPGVWWACRSLRTVRRELRTGRYDRVALAPPPGLGPEAERGVHAVLRRLEPSCLERALVLQSWLGARGEPRDVVIGVTSPDDTFRAHAWLEGESAEGFLEIARVLP
jgi:hypothetical protein